MLVPSASLPEAPLTARVRAYWNDHIHDLAITSHPVGSPGFFQDLDEYHFDKLHHLCSSSRSTASRQAGAGRRLRHGRGPRAVRQRRRRRDRRGPGGLGDRPGAAEFRAAGLPARLVVANAERLPFPEATVDFVFAHGVVQYTGDGRALVHEVRRVLKPGGEAVFQVYNRISWLNALSKLMKVDLEHEDAPVLRKYSATNSPALLGGFSDVRLVFERFPVKSRLHKGWKGRRLQHFLRRYFQRAAAHRWVERYGWHLLAFCRK